VQDEPGPWDIVRLIHYPELLLARLGVDQGLPQSRLPVPVATANGAYRVDPAAPAFARQKRQPSEIPNASGSALTSESPLRSMPASAARSIQRSSAFTASRSDT
jgi:hypothetical protein